MQSIPEILKAQNSCFKSQKTKAISFRLSLLKALKAEIINQEPAILEALHSDFKKSAFEAYMSEFALVISELNLAIKNLRKWTKPKRVTASLLTFPSKDYIYKAPYGTVLIIAPWNYPFLLALEPLIMAIAAGNTVVLKPSELTQNTSNIITEIIQKVFTNDICCSVEGGVETSTKLLAQHWDYIFFTGSTRVGKIVAKAAAQHLTPVTLELGGKSPCIIDDSNNLKLVARRLIWGKLFNGGQTCIAPDYIIVSSGIKNELIQCLIKEIEKQYGNTPKNTADFPRIVNRKNTERLKRLLANETLLFGGNVDSNEHYVAPTLVDNPKLDSALMTEEIFGPILPILTYDSEKDIEDIIYSLNKPLSFYIFSKDKTFTKSLILKFNFGGGVVNDTLVHFGNPKLPFGGVGASGMGKYHGKHGFDTFSHDKAIMKRGTWLDPSFRYAPYKGKMTLLRNVFKYLG
ncbi:aldehyde dehydrogenase [Hyunsoonleella sp. 2307UL5-6]|uniref:aldehyde dehydrogenase n=1 Tax=Hyunsoonleella sp. 2307UL5-6 TaxID=3384768 RepID=UPI0039BD5DE0